MSKHHHKKSKYNRRQFLGTATCAAIGSTTFFSTLFNLQAMNAASMQQKPFWESPREDYRALVCIMLGGGNDSFNMITPYSRNHYNEYARTRSNMALQRSSLLKMDTRNYNEKELGFHPALTRTKALYDQGKVAVVSNVGTLVQPTSKSDYFGTNRLPFGLYSHADQDQQWQTSVPQTNSPTGWAGRLADMVQAANSNQNISMNISLSGKNIFQLGDTAAEYSILPTGTGSIGIYGYGANNTFDQVRTSAVKSLMEKQYQDIFKKTYAETITASQNTHQLFSSAVGGSTLSTPFSANELSQRMQMVARTINVRQQLGVSRQTFFIRFDGFDNHDELINNHNTLMSSLDAAMGEFQAALAEMGLENEVTTFTISDFARTLTSNGNGTDHAWGGNMLVMGGKVNGKDVYGSYPSLALDSELEVGGGVLIPTLSTDEYFAELALWYGIPKSDLPILFPNIGNFYNTMSSMAPIGFMDLT
ncbi:MAG: DUF1501 domain-containing protein [Saprospiraceae bacterium]|nr:DUF1501 domain-containing protein [Saprospiraceae bacterium]